MVPLVFCLCGSGRTDTSVRGIKKRGTFSPTRWRSSPRLACNAKMFATHHKNKGHHLVWCPLCFACAVADAPTPAYEASQKRHFSPTRWRSSPRLACSAKMFATHHRNKGHHLAGCLLFFACAAADAPTPAYEASQKGHFFPHAMEVKSALGV